ncbi:MAG: radical SAM protein [Candidatus Omnitrophica bacterium]|nr:radical SAM protein [Candidatus Omnitrophota bacterium]
MPIIEPAIRPPSESSSFLLQVTTGCSSNYCTFCGAYQDKEFKVKDEEEIYDDIRQGAAVYPCTRKVFLLDGDALVVSNRKLVRILKKLQEHIPSIRRISSYANGYNITIRSDEELKELFDNKLKLLYIGLESGNQDILNACKKKSTVDEMITAVNRTQEIGIKASVIVLLGLGGRGHFKEHARDTIKAINKMQPHYLSFLCLMLIPGTPLYAQADNGKFQELEPQELLKQSYEIIKGLELKKTIFRSNHASNYLSQEGILPRDKGHLLEMLEKAISGKIRLKPEIFRGL